MNHQPTRERKLLVHKRELQKIESKLNQKGLTMVPTRIYFSRGLAKVEIALARGKTYGDKRDKMKDRQMKRDVGREMNRYR
jgi:SsrA-binding protein